MRRCRRRMRILGLAVALVLLLLPTVTRAAAPEPTLTLQAPAQATLGEAVALKATLLAPDGSPITGVPVQFFSPTSFASVSGEMLLGEATTDETGVALFQYEPRRSESVQIIARFAGNGRYGLSEASTTMSVQGSAQLYQEEAGVRVPGLGVWLLAGIVGAVWSTYFVVLVLVSLIAREGAPHRGIPGVMQ